MSGAARADGAEGQQRRQVADGVAPGTINQWGRHDEPVRVRPIRSSGEETPFVITTYIVLLAAPAAVLGWVAQALMVVARSAAKKPGAK